jgi:predicted Zn-dependent peptidase
MQGYSTFEVNNLRVVNLKNSSELASFGVAMVAGSNFETPEISGIAHFAEHMFFKGTEKRSYFDITTDFARYGADANAYTSNSEVYYYAVGRKENVNQFGEIILDMVFNSTFPESEIEKERGVITEEKHSYDDDSSACFSHETFAKLFQWDKGHPILGEFETIDSISRDDIVAYLDKNCNRNNIVIVCCGNVKDGVLKKMIEDNIPADHPYLKDGDKNVADGTLFIPDSPDRLIINDERFSQAIVSLVTEALPYDHDLGAAQKVAVNILGGGMHSMLFDRIREELGLCYAVYSYDHALAYPSANAFITTGHVSPDNVDAFIDETNKIIKNVIKNGFSQDLFECAKNSLLTDILRSTETSSGRGFAYVKKIILGDMDAPSIIDQIKDVKLEECNEVIKLIGENTGTWASMSPKGE